MRELALLTFQSLDGVMQAPSSPDEDRSGDFAHGGWAAPHWEEVMELVMKEALAQPYDILFGRKTYELFASHFPEAPQTPKTTKLNEARKYVATNTLTELKWQNSTPISGDIPAKVAQLKQQDGPLLQVHGSAKLIQSLLSHDLVDQLRLFTFPIVVGGTGKRLFELGSAARRFEHTKTTTTPNGVVMSFYRRTKG